MKKRIKITKDKILTLLLVGLCLLAGLQNLAFYIRPEFNVILCLMAAPFVFRVWEKGSFSYRYAVGAVVALGLFAWLHMQIFFLFGVGMSLLFIIESRTGKLGALPLVLLILLSPVLKYLVTVFTFPLRLKFSSMAAWALNAIGRKVEVSGNVFTMNGFEFSVDPACLGLNTLISGLIFTTLIIAFAQHNHGKRLRFPVIAGLYGLALFLLVGSNLLRIICLVLFKSMPDTAGHELIGLLCHVLYVLLPIYGLVWVLMKKNVGVKKLEEVTPKEASPRHKYISVAITLALIFGISILNVKRENFRNEPHDPAFAEMEIPGFDKTLMENGIARFDADSVMIYLKPPVRFWGADHTPSICWGGSGYNFTYIRKHLLGDQTIFLAQLEKGDDILYTAWWYDNGVIRTHDQLQWRWLTITGKAKFRLVNVAACEETELLEVCERLLFEKPSL